MDITASSLRRGAGGQDPVVWTDMLVRMISGLIVALQAGDPHARSQLESQLLYAQQVAYQSPFVSCTHQLGVAHSFALYGNTPGYVLTFRVSADHGVDFQ